ncbi:hypothetical protein WOLCODRAFT_163493 [Wolfiporia cocos MD-104 SS10]|uniref:Uncharacterized protein n=1 Tax=Wolfiporia cocos (strain MD-104) TaxID=742152 RepID=A0A2H3JT58_WOLCO|nr:hypothetical protein WOLCODRAFT_163493 [Wolfiporia cocos MD-104 SS10]
MRRNTPDANYTLGCERRARPPVARCTIALMPASEQAGAFCCSTPRTSPVTQAQRTGARCAGEVRTAVVAGPHAATDASMRAGQIRASREDNCARDPSGIPDCSGACVQDTRARGRHGQIAACALGWLYSSASRRPSSDTDADGRTDGGSADLGLGDHQSPLPQDASRAQIQIRTAAPHGAHLSVLTTRFPSFGPRNITVWPETRTPAITIREGIACPPAALKIQGPAASTGLAAAAGPELNPVAGTLIQLQGP